MWQKLPQINKHMVLKYICIDGYMSTLGTLVHNKNLFSNYQQNVSVS